MKKAKELWEELKYIASVNFSLVLENRCFGEFNKSEAFQRYLTNRAEYVFNRNCLLSDSFFFTFSLFIFKRTVNFSSYVQ